MLQINFYPESDKPEYIEAAKEYARIWNEYGERIVTSIEIVSGFKFKTSTINALTHGGYSYSVPMQLNSKNASEDEKKRTLIHELCHRLLVDNKVKKVKGKIHSPTWNYEVHKIVDLILWDIWVDLFGEEFAKWALALEKSFSSSYKRAWDFTLSNFKTKDQRKQNLKIYFTE